MKGKSLVIWEMLSSGLENDFENVNDQDFVLKFSTASYQNAQKLLEC